MDRLNTLGLEAGRLLTARGESIAIAESSAGGLISAALLAMPGASRFYLGGSVVYTPRALKVLNPNGTAEVKAAGMRSSSEPYAAWLAGQARQAHRAVWGLSETGAAGPDGNVYGDPAGHAWVAVDGPVAAARVVATGSADREANMTAFAAAGLSLLIEALNGAS